MVSSGEGRREGNKIQEEETRGFHRIGNILFLKKPEANVAKQ